MEKQFYMPILWRDILVPHGFDPESFNLLLSIPLYESIDYNTSHL